MNSKAIVRAGIPLVFLACTDVADDRAERDEIVGHYSDPTTKIDVDAGLAVIRRVDPGGIVVWSSAPAWSATITTREAGPLWIELRNIVPGSMLVAEGPSGEDLAVSLVEEPLATRRTFVLDAPAYPLRLHAIPPTTEEAASFRFAVLSDIQEAIVNVGDVYRRIAAEPQLDFVLSAGDLTQQGTRSELERFETELESLPIPFYTTLGNHELGTTPTVYQELFGRANLHFHHRGAAFSLVDSGSATLSRRCFEWLEGWLDEDRARVHFFATHYPPIDPIGVRNGSFASRVEAHQLIARLAEGRIDLSLHGHVHSYYSFTMGGVPSYISGGGGAIPERFDGIGRHFLVVEVGSDSEGQGEVRTVRVVRVD